MPQYVGEMNVRFEAALNRFKRGTRMRCAKFGVVAISLNLVPWPGRTAGNIRAKVAELAEVMRHAKN